MDTFPNYEMYAIIKNNYVVDAAFGGPEVFISAGDNNKTYSVKDGYSSVLVTLENSPINVGDYYDGDSFLSSAKEYIDNA